MSDKPTTPGKPVLYAEGNDTDGYDVKRGYVCLECSALLPSHKPGCAFDHANHAEPVEWCDECLARIDAWPEEHEALREQLRQEQERADAIASDFKIDFEEMRERYVARIAELEAALRDADDGRTTQLKALRDWQRRADYALRLVWDAWDNADIQFSSGQTEDDGLFGTVRALIAEAEGEG